MKQAMSNRNVKFELSRHHLSLSIEALPAFLAKNKLELGAYPKSAKKGRSAFDHSLFNVFGQCLENMVGTFSSPLMI